MYTLTPIGEKAHCGFNGGSLDTEKEKERVEGFVERRKRRRNITRRAQIDYR